MITITLGTISFPFTRAIDWIGTLLEEGTINEPVFIQYGTSDISAIAHHPLVTAVPLIEYNQLMDLVRSSRLIISHGGQGSVRTLASLGASFVAVPRLAKYNEHIDDHQLLFLRSVERLGVTYCLSLESLRQTVINPPTPFRKPLFNGPRLADFLLKTYPVAPLDSSISLRSREIQALRR